MWPGECVMQSVGFASSTTDCGVMPQAHKLAALLFGNPLYFLSTFLASAGIWTVLHRLPDRALQATLLPPVAWFAVYWLAWLVSKVLLFEWYVYNRRVYL